MSANVQRFLDQSGAQSVYISKAMPAMAESAIQRTGCAFFVFDQCVKKRTDAATARHFQLMAICSGRKPLPQVSVKNVRHITLQPAAAISPMEAGRSP